MKLSIFAWISLIFPIFGWAQNSPLALYSSCSGFETALFRLNCPKPTLIDELELPVCKRILRNQKYFSASGQQIMGKIRYCLQSALIKDIDLTCSNASKKALQSHVECFLKNDYCRMSPKDKFFLMGMASQGIVYPEVLSTFRRITVACVPTKNLNEFLPAIYQAFDENLTDVRSK